MKWRNNPRKNKSQLILFDAYQDSNSFEYEKPLDVASVQAAPRENIVDANPLAEKIQVREGEQNGIT